MSESPLSFDDWKGNKAESFDDALSISMNRLHGTDYKKEFEDMLTVEYQNYVDDFNGNWLLK